MRYLLAIFIILIIPFSVFASVVINEVAWMGMAPKEGESSLAAANNEWIELYNPTTTLISLEGWKISAEDGKPDILLSGTISAGSYFLLERANDDTIPNVPSDLIYPFKDNSLSNNGEILILKDSTGKVIDRVDGSDNWKIGGNNTTKETLQRTLTLDWITAPPTPKQANQQESLSFQNQSQGQAQITEPEQTKQIKVEAGDDKIVFVGQKALFQGKVFGFNNEEIKNARFLWNFGDGTINEGNPISHIYRYPGEHVVILNASSGIYANRDQLRAKVSASPLKITGLKPGENGFVEISNQSNYEIDISGFSFSDGKKYFYFPENSIIPAGSRTLVSGNISGINFASPSSAKFYYPDDSLIQEFKYEGEKIADKNIIAEFPKISAPIVKNTGIKDIIKNKEENILASSATIQNENREKQRSIYFWLAIVFGIASFSGIVSFFFVKSGENDKIPKK